MKKVVGILSVLLILLLIIWCYNQKIKDNQFIEKVKKYETNETELDFLNITYDEYKKNIRGILTVEMEEYYLKNKDKRHFLRIIDDKDLRMRDLENINEEEFKEYKKIINENNKENGIKQIDIKIEISNDNYESLIEGNKRVYSKTTRTIFYVDKAPTKSFIFKAYDFKKMKKEWKIEKISRSYAKGNSSKIMLPFTAYTPENNRKTKYIESINISKKFN